MKALLEELKLEALQICEIECRQNKITEKDVLAFWAFPDCDVHENGNLSIDKFLEIEGFQYIP